MSFVEFEGWWRASKGGTADEHMDDNNTDGHIHLGGELKETKGHK